MSRENLFICRIIQTLVLIYFKNLYFLLKTIIKKSDVIYFLTESLIMMMMIINIYSGNLLAKAVFSRDLVKLWCEMSVWAKGLAELQI